jgi:hypothetical protein
MRVRLHRPLRIYERLSIINGGCSRPTLTMSGKTAYLADPNDTRSRTGLVVARFHWHSHRAGRPILHQSEIGTTRRVL